jgi:hypothetical protein
MGQQLDVGVRRKMGDRSDLVFITLMIAVLLLTDSLWLALLNRRRREWLTALVEMPARCKHR